MINKPKIAFVGAVPFNLIFGGGETQQLKTMAALKALGVAVEFYDRSARAFEYEIVHVFGCHYWNYQLAHLAKSKGAKIVLSPISYNPCPSRAYKMWRHFDRFVPMDTTFRLHRKMVDLADVLLPNSVIEGDYIHEFFGADKSRMKVVPYGADPRFTAASPRQFVEKYGLEDFVLCVGKIEPRKNQVNLAKAMGGGKHKLVVIGEGIPNRRDYFSEFKSVVDAHDNITHIDFLPHDSDLLASAYAACRVHVLLGTNETPGIVNLEAGLAGANLVVANCPPVREYLSGFAEYCDPAVIGDIQRAIAAACSKPRSTALRDRILTEFTWEIAAQRTKAAYDDILKSVPIGAGRQ